MDGKPSHVGRGQVSPRVLPERARILEPARTRYAGFNDQHFCENFPSAARPFTVYSVRPGSPPYS